MSKLFQNKYRSESHRMPNWDYSRNGKYFITFVTQNRECNLGEIVSGKMILSNFGTIVNNEWYRSFEIRDELFLDEFIIMPNHLHAIVIIKNNDLSVGMDGLSDDVDGLSVGMDGLSDGMDGLSVVDMDGRPYLQHSVQSIHSNHPTHPVQPIHPDQPIHSVQPNDHEKTDKPKMPIRLPKSISSFVAGYKSAVNTKIDDYIDENNLQIPKYNRKNHFFQPNYHDRIIRNNDEYWRIKNYIKSNPKKWDEDKFKNEK